MLKEILSCLFLIAKADNVCHLKENEHLENAAEILGLSEAAFQWRSSISGTLFLTEERITLTNPRG